MQLRRDCSLGFLALSRAAWRNAEVVRPAAPHFWHVRVPSLRTATTLPSAVCFTVLLVIVFGVWGPAAQ